ncbi:Vacuolar import and degradation protein 27 [Rhodotorula toruloides]|uniref:VID27 cytoplasmic protein-domain containing protein n=1 Tax=Rhodotorula toruloides TaxID=5286 RepID=A0A2S9ZWE3_RHOTO|nr:VID27 cytoplasmic protein-domain containing protein [Rhodotorula toruloides]
MFLVNRLFGISGQSGPAPELTTLDGGRLFLVRPDSVKGSRECIFIDASLSIRRTTHAHMYQLVVTRAFQEGEEQLLEEDAENSDERSFLLDSSLFLSLGPSLDPISTSTSSALSFTWLDPDGDGPDDEFEFVLPSDGSVSASQAEEFERLCWRCMWERKEVREWPEDEREARRVEETLEEEFKVERAPQQPASSLLYPTLPPTDSPAATPSNPAPSSASTPATTSRLPPPVSSSKAPLFRATSPDAESDDEAPAAGQKTTSVLPDSDEEDAFDEAREGVDDSGDELAQQLRQKATIGGGGPAQKTAASPAKGKGKAKAAPVPVEDPIAPPMPRPPVPAAPSTSSDAPAPVITVLASLHLYDRATGLFMLQDDSVKAGLYKLGQAGKGHWLVVESVGKEADVWVSQAITAETTVNFAEKERAMVFNYTAPPSSDDSQSQPITYTWLLRLSTDEAFAALQASVSAALFEDKWGAGSWGKLKEDDREYARKAWLEEDAEMWDAEKEDAEEAEAQEEESEEEEEPEPVPESDDEEYDSDDAVRAPSASRAFTSKRPSRPAIGTKKRPKNSALAVGYKEDLSFVVQGDMIGVFKQQREGGKKLKFVTSIVNIATPDKKGFTPGKVMLHNQDTSMILQNPLAPGSLYRLDLETGKVVDEYKVSSDFSVSNFLPDSKFAQTTQQQTFIGHSHNGLFRIDPRLAGSKLVESEFKQYATKADFSAAATTESGRLAVASSKGDIRLFDKLGKNAKTALPALGDPIIGVDVSADGRWLLATCRTYLLLIDTMIPDSSSSKFAGQLGFDRSFPAAEKPTPRRLTLKPEHVAHMQEVQGGEGVSFTPAKFNASLSGDPERTIVTSTGPFIVAWNFRQVKSGNTSNYTLRRFSEEVVADNFKFGGDREIIVTLPENVFVEEKKKLKAPTRASIVQTWDGL